MVISNLEIKELLHNCSSYVAILACGYEARSSRLIQDFEIGSAIVLDYKSSGILSYDANFDNYCCHGIDCVGAESFLRQVEEIIDKDTVVVDISSFDRKITSAIVERIRCNKQVKTAYFLYHSGKYIKAGQELGDINFEEILSAHSDLSQGIVNMSPISTSYSGRLFDSSRVSVSILSIGFELFKASSALDYLDSDEKIMFYTSSNRQMSKILKDANLNLFRSIKSNSILTYSISDPAGLVNSLSQIFSQPAKDFFCITFGPKLFNCICCLLAIDSKLKNISVWHVEPSNKAEPLDVLPEGSINGIKVVF